MKKNKNIFYTDATFVYCVAFNYFMVLSVSKGQTQLSYYVIHDGQAEDLVISH